MKLPSITINFETLSFPTIVQYNSYTFVLISTYLLLCLWLCSILWFFKLALQFRTYDSVLFLMLFSKMNLEGLETGRLILIMQFMSYTEVLRGLDYSWTVSFSE